VERTIYSEEYKELLELLIQARKHMHLTQQELAHKLDEHQSFVSKYESGERRLDVIEFLQIVKSLGADPCDIIKKIS
jgi:transcriptional regulator with XRE-family HTH domain